jgi:hypothetical protein
MWIGFADVRRPLAEATVQGHSRAHSHSREVETRRLQVDTGDMLQRLVCWMSGHRWQATSDEAGSLTRCSRCGRLRRAGGDIDMKRAREEASMRGDVGGHE